MKKVQTVLIFLMAYNFFLNSETLELKWLLRAGNVFDNIQPEASVFRIDKIKYHIMLMELREIEKSLSLLNQNELELEKDLFLKYIYKNKFFSDNMNEKYLHSIEECILNMKKIPIYIIIDHLVKIGYFYLNISKKEEFKKILGIAANKVRGFKSPIKKKSNEKDYYMNLGIFYKIPDCLISIGQAYYDIGELDESRKILLLAVRRMMSIQNDCTIQSSYFTKIYKIYKSANLDKDKQAIFEQMINYYKYCDNEFLRKDLIFRIYSNFFIENGEFDKARIFLEKLIQYHNKCSEASYINDMVYAAEKYSFMKDNHKALELINQLLEQCFCKITQNTESIQECLENLNHYMDEYDLFNKIVCPNIIEWLSKKNQKPMDKKITNEINKIVIRFLIAQKKYQEAIKISKQMVNDDGKSFYIYLIAIQTFQGKCDWVIKDFINRIDDIYYKILLYSEIGRQYIKMRRNQDAIKFLDNAYILLRKLNFETNTNNRKVDIFGLINLYKSIDYSKGLKVIQNYYEKNFLEINQSLSYKKGVITKISLYLIEIYLKKGDFNSSQGIYARLEDPSLKVIAELHFSKYFLDRGNKFKAKRYLNDSYDFLKQINDISQIEQILDKFYQIFLRDKNGQYDSFFNTD